MEISPAQDDVRHAARGAEELAKESANRGNPGRFKPSRRQRSEGRSDPGPETREQPVSAPETTSEPYPEPVPAPAPVSATVSARTALEQEAGRRTMERWATSEASRVRPPTEVDGTVVHPVQDGKVTETFKNTFNVAHTGELSR